MKTIEFVGLKFGISYCPKCRVLYYQKEHCDCDKKEGGEE